MTRFLAKTLIVAIAAALLTAASDVSAKEFSREETRKVDAAGLAKLVVNNPRGATVVTGREGAGEFVVVVTHRAFARSQEKADELFAEIECVVERDGEKLVVATDRSDDRGGASVWSVLKGKSYAWIDYSIEIPERTEVETVSTSGGVRVTNVRAPVSILATSADVTVRDVFGDARVQVTSGSIEAKNIEGNLSVIASTGRANIDGVHGSAVLHGSSGKFEAFHIGGDADVRLGSGEILLKGCLGNVDLLTSSGDAEVLEAGGSINAVSSSGDLDIMILPVGEKKFNISSSSGDIGVRYLAPSDYGFLLDVNTTSGTIKGDMAIDVQEITRRRLKGVVGAGGSAKVLIETASGNVKIVELKDKKVKKDKD